MVKTIARKFGIPIVEFYFFRKLDAMDDDPPVH
jgi:hypothetical protein